MPRARMLTHGFACSSGGEAAVCVLYASTRALLACAYDSSCCVCSTDQTACRFFIAVPPLPPPPPFRQWRQRRRTLRQPSAVTRMLAVFRSAVEGWLGRSGRSGKDSIAAQHTP